MQKRTAPPELATGGRPSSTRTHAAACAMLVEGDSTPHWSQGWQLTASAADRCARLSVQRQTGTASELAIGEVVGACSSCCSNTAGFSASAASTALSSAAPAASTLARRCALHPTPPAAHPFVFLLRNIAYLRAVQAKAHVCLSTRPMCVSQNCNAQCGRRTELNVLARGDSARSQNLAWLVWLSPQNQGPGGVEGGGGPRPPTPLM